MPQVSLPGMDDCQVGLPGMDAAVAAAASSSSPPPAPAVRRRSSVGGPTAGDGRRASHILTQTILHEKRTTGAKSNVVSPDRLAELVANLSVGSLDNAGKVPAEP